MPFRGSSRATQTLSAAVLSALLLASAGKHFREPEFFSPMVPDFLCRDDSGARPNGPVAVMSGEEWVAASGLLEVGCAVGLLIPATRRAAAGCVAAMFTLFVAGHLDALHRASGPSGTARQGRIHAPAPVSAPTPAPGRRG